MFLEKDKVILTKQKHLSTTELFQEFENSGPGETR
jgi:hypothetical protein